MEAPQAERMRPSVRRLGAGAGTRAHGLPSRRVASECAWTLAANSAERVQCVRCPSTDARSRALCGGDTGGVGGTDVSVRVARATSCVILPLSSHSRLEGESVDGHCARCHSNKIV